MTAATIPKMSAALEPARTGASLLGAEVLWLEAVGPAEPPVEVPDAPKV